MLSWPNIENSVTYLSADDFSKPIRLITEKWYEGCEVDRTDWKYCVCPNTSNEYNYNYNQAKELPELASLLADLHSQDGSNPDFCFIRYYPSGETRPYDGLNLRLEVVALNEISLGNAKKSVREACERKTWENPNLTDPSTVMSIYPIPYDLRPKKSKILSTAVTVRPETVPPTAVASTPVPPLWTDVTEALVEHTVNKESRADRYMESMLRVMKRWK